MTVFNQGSSIWFGVSPAALDAAREALDEDRPLSSAFIRSTGRTLAPLIPITTRIAVLQHQIETTVRSAKRAGAPAAAIDALLAVAITVSGQFPEAN